MMQPPYQQVSVRLSSEAVARIVKQLGTIQAQTGRRLPVNHALGGYIERHLEDVLQELEGQLDEHA